MHIDIQKVTNASMAEALCRFRYAIYVEEMARPQKYADHVRRIIEDPLDEQACNLVAIFDGRIVGSIRYNRADGCHLDDYRSWLHLDDFGSSANRMAVVSRLMLAPQHRSTILLTRLLTELFRSAIKDGVRWGFCDCNDHLVQLFERYGWVRTHGFRHPEYGDVNAMCLDLLDEAHLRACGSPFIRAIADPMTTTGL